MNRYKILTKEEIEKIKLFFFEKCLLSFLSPLLSSPLVLELFEKIHFVSVKLETNFDSFKKDLWNEINQIYA